MDFLYAMILRNLGSILAALIIAVGAFFAAREGGRIAGESSRESVRETLEGQRQLDKDRQEEIVNGVLQAFYGELNIFWERLNEIVQDCWKEYEEEEKKGKKPILLLNLPFWGDHFPIYHSNANLIGQINEPPDLRHKIVKVYALFESLIRSYRINTMLVERRNEARTMWKEAQTRRDVTEISVNQMLYEERLSHLRSFAPKLKARHDQFRELIEDLLKVLEEKFPHLKN